MIPRPEMNLYVAHKSPSDSVADPEFQDFRISREGAKPRGGCTNILFGNFLQKPT